MESSFRIYDSEISRWRFHYWALLPFDSSVIQIWSENSSRKWSSRQRLRLQRAVLIPSYDWDSSRVSGGPPFKFPVSRRSSERAKLFNQRERKISGILPEAVNLARKSILLTLIGPMTEIEDSENLCLLNSLGACNGGRNYYLSISKTWIA